MNRVFYQFFTKESESEMCSGIFSDELDKMGHKHQVVAGWKLNNSALNVFGRVRTLSLETFETKDERIAKGLGFLGELGEGDVFVVGGSDSYAYFGELMSRLSMEVGIAGVVIDGLTRDTFYTQTIELPIFARGYSPVDIKGRGRVAETDVPLTVGGVKVECGDYLFGDSDAVVIIPQEIMTELAPHCLSAALEEKRIKQMIRQGKSIKEILSTVEGF
jgi:regulator of RNase E activity RraA